MFDMPQLTELQWFGAYLGFGACALVLMRLYVKWVVRPPQQSEFVTEMMAAIRADQPYDWRKTAKSVLFVPLAVLVWPLAIAVGIGEIRKPAKTYPDPAPEEKFRCQREHLRMPISIAEAQNLGVVKDPLRTRARPALWTSERRVANVSERRRGRLFTLVLRSATGKRAGSL